MPARAVPGQALHLKRARKKNGSGDIGFTVDFFNRLSSRRRSPGAVANCRTGRRPRFFARNRKIGFAAGRAHRKSDSGPERRRGPAAPDKGLDGLKCEQMARSGVSFDRKRQLGACDFTLRPLREGHSRSTKEHRPQDSDTDCAPKLP